VKIRQILIELHPYVAPGKKKDGVQTGSKEDFAVVNGFFSLLQKQGYVIFHKEQNNLSGNW